MDGKIVRFGATERSWLKDIVPLDSPLSIACDPSSTCNFRCVYCKNSIEAFRKTTRIMPFSTFEALIKNIKDSRIKIKALSLARDGEPLMNKNLADMIRLAKQSGIFENVVTISNGTLLNHDLSDELVNAELDRILISVQGLTKEKYASLCGYDIDMDSFMENISYLHSLKKCKVHIKGFYDKANGELSRFEEAFYRQYQSICDEISIEHVVDIAKEVDYSNIEINEDIDKYGEPAIKTSICPTSFYSLLVLPSGDVSICCLSSEPGFIIGNIFHDPIGELFNNEKIINHRLMQSKGRRYEHELCKKCYFPDKFINPTDRIDDCAENLTRYYSSCKK
jgi:GTP 3',8-cyclase